MSLAALRHALARTLDAARAEAVRIMRMDVSALDKTRTPQLLYGLRTQPELAQIALGADSDIGGLSRCHMRLDKDASGAHGRFYGSISAHVPRGAPIDRSGYAAFRNRSRPTLFSSLAWDMSYYPYLALRVRNLTPGAGDEHVDDATSLRAALHAGDPRGPGASRAVHALGITKDLQTKPHPLFFVNVQTDGPVSTDIYQHRLWLDESRGNEWQTVTIPLDDFVLTNSGVVADAQVEMMRERILTVGISVLLAPPSISEDAAPQSKPEPAREETPPEPHASEPASLTPSVFRRSDGAPPPPIELGARPPIRGVKRSGTHDFDLAVHSVWAVASPEQSAELFP